MAEQKYTALLRGINVGGHHKVPMADLRKTMEEMGFSEVKTLLNSGNVVFGGKPGPIEKQESAIAAQLEKTFGFPIPVLVRTAEDIQQIISSDRFKNIEVTKNLRLYVTFVRTVPAKIPELPWISSDGSYRIIQIDRKSIFSILDVSKMKTPDAMGILERTFSKDITTRNWNTILKIDAMLAT